jgi:hypothetical protein
MIEIVGRKEDAAVRLVREGEDHIGVRLTMMCVCVGKEGSGWLLDDIHSGWDCRERE